MQKAASSLRSKTEATKQNAAFGQAIYELRIKAELSQEELALASNVGRSYLGVLERGEKEPCLGIMFRLAKSLNTPLAELIGLTERLLLSGKARTKGQPRVR